ncbi:MAG: fucose isomerase [Verrucomicrobiales bacterium]|nr:fucose isomerase [Verrucomicrobiales bacterium]
MTPLSPVTLGVIVGNRGFFPAHLCDVGRREVLAKLEAMGITVVALPLDATKFGAVESLEDARRCAELFQAQAARLDGILVTLPNFGDERAVANALRWSGLRVPVLVHAFKDVQGAMTIRDRRDSFCGKMSVCNNLRQYGIPFSLTRLHTVNPGDPSFEQDLRDFVVTCRAVRALRHLRIGALGARPTAFNTVRYSEKLLERSGISIETLDLYELFGWIDRLKTDEADVVAKLAEIRGYVVARGIPEPALVKMAKFGVAVDRWMQRCGLKATAIQCWTAMEEFFGVVPCTLMSMMSNLGLSSACEVDVMGTVAMHVMAQSGGRPSALVDWNNNYGDDPDKGVIFHCSNLPKDLFVAEGEGQPVMDFQEIIAGTVGKENTYGTVVGRLKAAPFTFLRCTTDEFSGQLRAYFGEGEITNDPLKTFGGVGVVHIRDFQKLLRHICLNGCEHHVAVNPTRQAAGLSEAFRTYLGWDTYWHA